MEIDHLFICTSKGAPEAKHLVDFGLTEGLPNTHPGQGTACRRFYFHNLMLELLWLEDEEESSSPLTAPTQLFHRAGLRDPGTSPFGVCFRPSPTETAVSFPSWQYRPRYLPAHLSVEIAKDMPYVEPLWFYLGFSHRPDQAATPPNMQHACGFKEVTQVRITTESDDAFSSTAQTVMGENLLKLDRGDTALLELFFDEGKAGKEMDFRPHLPLVFHW
ncbi:MAG: glyoxalase-like domain protein [Gammaproteobacteria bacterium]|nr:glyoxalase-like domain protein [Gammaproteobacteria bacterium]